MPTRYCAKPMVMPEAWMLNSTRWPGSTAVSSIRSLSATQCDVVAVFPRCLRLSTMLPLWHTVRPKRRLVMRVASLMELEEV